MRRQRQLLERVYGFTWPDDIFEAFEMCHALNPDTPHNPLRPPFPVPGLPLNIRLVGPFELLFGHTRDHGDWPADTALLHWRFRRDPAEFFTIGRGDTDGYTWGYWLEEPGDATVASYYTTEALEVAPDGESFVQAARLALEESYQHFLDQALLDEHPEERELTTRMLDWIPRMREIVATFEPQPRSEEGDAYIDRYMVPRRVSLTTVDAMGLANVPKEACFGAVTGPGEKVREALESYVDDPDQHDHRFDQLQDFLDAKLWGSALQLGKALWVAVDDGYKLALGEMMAEAYAALGRDTQARTIRAHGQFPALSVVSISDVAEQVVGGVQPLGR